MTSTLVSNHPMGGVDHLSSHFFSIPSLMTETTAISAAKGGPSLVPIKEWQLTLHQNYQDKDGAKDVISYAPKRKLIMHSLHLFGTAISKWSPYNGKISYYQ